MFLIALAAPLPARAQSVLPEATTVIPPGCPQYPNDCPDELGERLVATSQANYEAILTAYGVSLSTLGGCARYPWTGTGCPPMTQVVVTLSETACPNESDTAGSIDVPCGPLTLNRDPTFVPYVPLAGPPTGDASAQNHGTGAACGVRAEGPTRIYNGTTDNHYMRGRSANHCLTGQGITWMETWGTLQRERLDNKAGWTNLDSDYDKKAGAGWLYSPYSFWDCQHSKAYLYRMEAYGYAVQRGVGFGGLNRRVDSLRCPK